MLRYLRMAICERIICLCVVGECICVVESEFCVSVFESNMMQVINYTSITHTGVSRSSLSWYSPSSSWSLAAC